MPPTLRKRKAPPSEPRRRPPFRLEFRAPVDGAWYDARVTVQCGALRVMYEGFPEELDEWYDPAALAAAAAAARDVATLRARFRVRSTPLEDTQCRDLRAGALLCVSCALDGGELKFYDAVLESVLPAAHEIVDGKERCACRFTVRWSEGPRAGSREEVGVEQVCCVQSSPVQDPVLIEFLDGVTKLLGDVNGEMVSQEIRAVPAAEGRVPYHNPARLLRRALQQCHHCLRLAAVSSVPTASPACSPKPLLSPPETEKKREADSAEESRGGDGALLSRNKLCVFYCTKQ